MSKRKIKNLPARRLKQTKRFTFSNKHDWLGFCNWVAKQKQKKKKEAEIDKINQTLFDKIEAERSKSGKENQNGV